MNALGQVRGYASVFNIWSSRIVDVDGSRFREKIRPGAFRLLGVIEANVIHSAAARVATTWDRSLRLWQDSHGLAFELDVAATQGGVGLLNMVSGGVNSMSIGLITLAVTDFCDESGFLRREITRADIDHITFTDAAAYPGTACWLAGTPTAHLRPEIAAASRRWNLGQIAYEQKRAADRDLVARYLTKGNTSPAPQAKKLAVKNYKPETVVLPPKPAAWIEAEKLGLI
jgi:HK97 family phage prohead protease